MNKLGLYYIIGLLAVSMFYSCKPTANKPNVIIVVTDDQGWGDIGYNGNQMLNTPTLDSLAKQSVVLDRFYVSPVCAPSRASLLTGKYHLASGVSWVTHRKEVMRESETTIAEIFKANNYQTAYFGKWHNGAQYPHDPIGQGFDQFFGFCGGHWNNYFDTELQWNHSMKQTQGYIADVLTDSLINYIQHSEEPFLAVLAYNTPHTPYQVPDRYFNKYVQMGLNKKTAAVYGMIENIDNNIDRLLKTLNKKGEIDNTIFIFTSDNGPNFVRYNGGLKGRKGQVDEGGVRVPFMIHYPNGKFKTRHISDGFACHMDLLPTLLELCQIQSNIQFHGSSFSTSLRKNKALSTNRTLFSHQVLNENGMHSNAVRTNEYLLTCYPGDTALFHLLDDPHQMKNIIGKEQKLADSLVLAYQKWLKEVTKTGIEPEPIRVDDKMDASINLPAHEASLSEGLAFAGTMGWANDWVTNWDSTNDSMYWNIQVNSDCIYEVSLLLACNEADIGRKLRVGTVNEQNQITITRANKAERTVSYDRVKRDEVPERKWCRMNLGNIDLTKSDRIIGINLIEEVPTSIEIKGLQLIPCEENNQKLSIHTE